MAPSTSEPVFVFTRRLNALGLPYMVTGGVASMLYGEPRLTLDVDVVLDLTRGAIVPLADAFPLAQFYCPPLEVLAAEVARRERGHFNLIEHATGARADVYLVGSDPLHVWAMARVRTLDLDGETVRIAPPEYVIVRKLEFHREGGAEKHVRDVQAMLRVSGPDIDRAEVERWVGLRGLRDVWDRVSSGL
jgi:hypothetical protein